MCSEHGKQRTAPNMLPDENGGWKCRPSSQCSTTPGAPRSLILCSAHGKRRTAMNMVPDGNGGFKCRPGSECKVSERRNCDAGPTSGRRPKMNNVCAVPKPDSAFGSSTVIALDLDFVYGIPSRSMNNNTQIQTMPFPVAGTIMFWNSGDKLVLFQGRIAIPEGIEVVDDGPVRKKAGINPPWIGTSLETITKLLSIYGLSAWASADGTVLVGHTAQYYLQCLSVDWPSSLVCDITENFQAQNQSSQLTLEDAYLGSVRPVLPGDPSDPLIRCRMNIEMYLFLKEFSQNNSIKGRTKQGIAQENHSQNPSLMAPPQSLPSQVPVQYVPLQPTLALGARNYNTPTPFPMPGSYQGGSEWHSA